MSFNPNSVAAFAAHAPEGVAWGLTTCAFQSSDWPNVPAARRTELARLTDLRETGASFLSHDRRDLDSPAVIAARASGCPVLTWTVRSPKEELMARRHADNITFESYMPDRVHAPVSPRPAGPGWRKRTPRNSR